MVRKLYTFFLLLITVYTLPILAVKHPVKSSAQIRRDIKTYEKRIRRVTFDISKIEKKLEKANARYLSLANKKGSLSQGAEELRYEVAQEKQTINKQISKLKKRLHHVVMTELSGLENPEEIIAYKILKKDLNKKIKRLNRLKDKTSGLQKVLSSNIDKLREINELQRDLIDLSNQLESEKKAKALSYINIKNKRNSLKEDLKKVIRPKRKLITSKKTSLGYFTSPIAKRVGLDYKKKGVTYLFSKSQPLLTTRAGKIIHIGSLSTYGNVIMIDHGNETRSVLLGDFKPKVKKGTTVSEGQVLGYSRLRSGQEGKVYFEVRKKNKVYKTINLIKV